MADFYIHRGPYRRPAEVDDSEYALVPIWVKIVLDGPRQALALMLPTCPLEELDPALFEHWIPAIQGPIVTRCDASDEQRELLLHIALAIHAFTEGFPGIDPDDYGYFMGRVVEAALSVEPDERCEERVTDLVDWLHGALPAALFDGDHIPPVTEEEFETPLVWQLATGRLSMPVFSRWRGESGTVGTAGSIDVGDQDDADSNSSGSIPPLVDYESNSD
ncbi:hypothetical protein TRAPUB_338 [Trametes pubescens]|uniref:Uncharacterized protein n=1 Tax=Trametes pubescens TaxID=154538 RepID=A0A1M2VMD8_TRAPU|nr:hypothetical protein TRAPUB_338 [Trametes pubescens]